MRSAALYNSFVLAFETAESRYKFIHRGEKRIFYRHDRGDVHRRGESVVGTLALVYIVVGMQQFFARDFVAAVGNDFVGVHIRLRAAARLPDDEREMFVEFARNHFVASGAYRFEFFFGKFSEIVVCNRGGFFKDSERVRDFSRHYFRADFEILETSLRLRRPVLVVGYAHFAHSVFFNTISHNNSC